MSLVGFLCCYISLHLGSQAKCAAVYWHCFCSFSEAEWLFLDLHGSISRQGILWKPWKKILPLSDILSMRTGIVELNVYLNQRHLAFGLLMVTLALYLFMDWLEAGTAHEEKGILWIKTESFRRRMEKQKSGSGTAYGNVSGSVCVLEWGSSDRWSADFVRLCDFLGWKSGLRCHGGGIHLLFLASVKDFYCWKCYEFSDLSGISGRG